MRIKPGRDIVVSDGNFVGLHIIFRNNKYYKKCENSLSKLVIYNIKRNIIIYVFMIILYMSIE